MKIFYIVGLIVSAFVLIYLYGMQIGHKKCQDKILMQSFNQNLQFNKHKEDIDEKVYTTGVGDIRDFLRNKYSIAD